MDKRSRVKYFNVGESFFINISYSKIASNTNAKGVEEKLLVEMRDDQAGEYIVVSTNGERISLDGYERAYEK